MDYILENIQKLFLILLDMIIVLQLGRKISLLFYL